MRATAEDPAARARRRGLPRGRNALPAEVVLVSQTERLVGALVEAVAEMGYRSTRVEDIVRRAGVSRGTFYKQFRDKEDAFLSAYMVSSRQLFEAVDAAGGNVDGDPLGPLRRGTRAYLEGLAAEPAWSRAFIVEIRAVPAAENQRQQVHDWYVGLMRRWREWALRLLGGHPVPDCAFEACVDAINELVGRYVVTQGPEGVLSLEPAVLYIQLALLGFPDEAAAVLPGARSGGDPVPRVRTGT